MKKKLSPLPTKKANSSTGEQENFTFIKSGHVTTGIQFLILQWSGLIFSLYNSPFIWIKIEKRTREFCLILQNKRKTCSGKSLQVNNGDEGIRTPVPLPANAFRVRRVMTTSLRLHIDFKGMTCSVTQYNTFLEHNKEKFDAIFNNVQSPQFTTMLNLWLDLPPQIWYDSSNGNEWVVSSNL